MEIDELGNEVGLKREAMDEDLRMDLMDLGEGGGDPEQGEEHNTCNGSLKNYSSFYELGGKSFKTASFHATIRI